MDILALGTYILQVTLNADPKSNSKPSAQAPPPPPSWTPCDAPGAEWLSVGNPQMKRCLSRCSHRQAGKSPGQGSRNLGSKPSSVTKEQHDLGQILNPVWPLLSV